MTKFSFEVPIKHLQDFDEDQDFIFSLSLLFQHDDYVKYIRRVKLEGIRTVWLDNSFNETGEPDNVDSLATLAQTHDVNRIIAPDHPDWGVEKIKQEYLRAAGFIGLDRTTAVVSNPLMAQELAMVGCKNFAIPYRTRHNWEDEDLQKVPRAHFLGLNNIPELLECKPLSCDTSMPIKLAITGRSLYTWQSEGYPHIHTGELGHHGQDFFQMTMTTKEIDLAKENIWTLRNALTDTNV